jgi:outer membrane protein OmpA-like peptidoglycan-associated protein
MRTTILIVVAAALGLPAVARAGEVPAPPPPTGPPALGEVRFAFDSAVVDPRERGELESARDWIADHPQGYLVIEGHTCPVGTYAYNAGLGVRRAEAVRAALVALGADPARLVVGVYGEASQTGTTNAANRRVVVRGTTDSLAAIEKKTLRRGIAVVWDYRPTGKAVARNQTLLRRFFEG